MADLILRGTFYRSFQQATGLRINVKDLRANPLTLLQPHIASNILPQNDIIFSPSESEMKAAEKIFVSSQQNNIKYLTSVMKNHQLPNTNLLEVAFMGRSNVGKSSLIQTMFKDSPEVMIRVSKKPGHTRMLNFFQVGRSFNLVDMPGYGYNMPENFVENVETYLRTRRKLTRSFVLLDAGSGISSVDEIGLKMMEEFKIPYVIVLTKIDKVGRHILLKNLLSILDYRQKYADCCLPQPFLVSAMSGAGISLMKTFIAYVTGNVQIEGL
ncbi:hypothetical protein ScPMuIL_010657 [Solemya velum]